MCCKAECVHLWAASPRATATQGRPLSASCGSWMDSHYSLHLARREGISIQDGRATAGTQSAEADGSTTPWVTYTLCSSCRMGCSRVGRAESLLQARPLAGRGRRVFHTGPLWPVRVMLWLPSESWAPRCRSRAEWGPQCPGALRQSSGLEVSHPPPLAVPPAASWLPGRPAPWLPSSGFVPHTLTCS